MARGPPWKTPLTYWKNPARTYIRNHRTGWSNEDEEITIMTIWHGNQNIRLQCNAAVRAHANPGPGLPNPNPIPNHPYITADKNTAMATGTIPPARQATGRGAHRQGQGAQIVAPAPLPQPPPAQYIALPQVPVQNRQAPNHQSQDPQIHAYQAQQHISVAQQPYDDKVPFDFWPQLPWDAEPDATGWPDPVKITDQVGRAEEGDRWKDLPPHQWPVGDESHWQGVRFLAAGGYGSAGLYVEVENGSIKDRMVVKETGLSRSSWRDPTHWRKRLPREIAVHRIIDNRRKQSGGRSFRHLARHRGYRLMMRQHRYRIYLDFYAGGDLLDATSVHFCNYNAERPTQMPNGTSFEPIPIYEGFMWYMFRALVKGCMILQKGDISNNEEFKVTDWKPITHLDLQKANVFLDTERDDQGWPTPVVSDFGFSFYSLDPENTSICDNPGDYLIAGFDGRYAPEHQPNDRPIASLGEKTDVWGIGSIMWSLVVHSVGDAPVREAAYFDREDGKMVNLALSTAYFGAINYQTIMDHAVFTASRHYSLTLRDLVSRCLQRDPARRPSLVRLQAEIQTFLDNNPQIRDSRPPLPLILPSQFFDPFAVGQPNPKQRQGEEY